MSERERVCKLCHQGLELSFFSIFLLQKAVVGIILSTQSFCSVSINLIFLSLSFLSSLPPLFLARSLTISLYLFLSIFLCISVSFFLSFFLFSNLQSVSFSFRLSLSVSVSLSLCVFISVRQRHKCLQIFLTIELTYPSYPNIFHLGSLLTQR